MGKRAQRIPSWPGVIHSNKGRIHLRRPTSDILAFRLRRSGGPYIPVCPVIRPELAGGTIEPSVRASSDQQSLARSRLLSTNLAVAGPDYFRLADNLPKRWVRLQF